MRTLTIFVAGMIVGWLVAPDTGAHTRNSLRKFINRFSGEDKDEGLEKTPITSDDVLRTGE